MPEYSLISKYYDAIFPFEQADMAFFAKLLQGKRRLIDIGCGTGNSTRFLAEPGREILALDGDPGMIDVARQKHAAPGLNYLVLDMRQLRPALAADHPEGFDAALCLGNTLVHLPSSAEIAAFLHDLAALLQPGALFIVQILHYDQIAAEKRDSLPTLETEDLRFVRRYIWQGEKLRFVTSLINKKSGESCEGDIPLYPLRQQELHKMLLAAGFGEISYYGSYSGAPLTAESLPLIAVARRLE